MAAVALRSRWHRFHEDSVQFNRRGSPILVLEDGRWAIAEDATEMLHATRAAVREKAAKATKDAASRPDPAVIKAQFEESERRREARGAELAQLSRALLVAYPPHRPMAVAILDVGKHEVATYVGEELDQARAQLAGYDILGGVAIRALLQSFDFDPGPRRLAELGPPQKTMKLNKRGRTLKITTELLIQGSCGIGRPFGEKNALATYLAAGDLFKLRRRLEADAKSLYALYEYGRLHGVVRLRWGFLDDSIPAPWVHRDEPRLCDLKKSALEMNVPLEVIDGNAPAWGDPWGRSRIAYVQKDESGWRTWLVDWNGTVIESAFIQRARLMLS